MLLQLVFILFSLIRPNTVYVSSVGDDASACIDLDRPCATINYAYSQGTDEEITVRVIDDVGFPETFTPEKSATTHVRGNPMFWNDFTSKIYVPPTVKSLQPVLLLSIEDLILDFVSSTATFIRFTNGTVEINNVLVVSEDESFLFNNSFIDADGTGILRLIQLNITNFNNTNTNGLIYVHSNARALIINSTFHPYSIVSTGSIIQITDTVSVYASNTSFVLTSDEPTTASVISLNSNLTAINNVTIFECNFSGFHLAKGEGAILSILGHSHNSNLLFDDNIVTNVSTTDADPDSDGGGAIVINDGRGYVRIVNNVFRDVSASGNSDGGAVLSTFQGDVYIYNNIFANASSNGQVGGGAVSLQNGSVAIVDSNFFYGCNATANGGALLSNAIVQGTVLYNNTFQECVSGGNGGAVYLSPFWTTYVTYNTFQRNKAAKNGGGAYFFMTTPGTIVPFLQFLLNVFDNNQAGGIGYDLGFNTQHVFRPWNINFITASISYTVAGKKIGIEDADLDVDFLLPEPQYHYSNVYVSPTGNNTYPCGHSPSDACGLLEYAFLLTSPQDVAIIEVLDGNYTNASAIAINDRYLLVVGNFDNTIIQYTPIEAPYALFSVSAGLLDIENLTFTSYEYYNPEEEEYDSSFNRNLFFVLAEGNLFLSNIHILPNSNNTIIYGSIINVTGGVVVAQSLNIENIILGNSAAVSVRENRHYSHAGNDTHTTLLNATLIDITAVNVQRLAGSGAIVEGVLMQGNVLTIESSKFISTNVSRENAFGGAIYLYLTDNFDSGYNFTDVTFQRNSAFHGGAIFIDALVLERVVYQSVFNFDWESLDDSALEGYSSRTPTVVNLKSILVNGRTNKEKEKEKKVSK